MINVEINRLKDKLNNMIAKSDDYNEIYRLSVEIDKLISRFYKSLDGDIGYQQLYYKNS